VQAAQAKRVSKRAASSAVRHAAVRRWAVRLLPSFELEFRALRSLRSLRSLRPAFRLGAPPSPTSAENESGRVVAWPGARWTRGGGRARRVVQHRCWCSCESESESERSVAVAQCSAQGAVGCGRAGGQVHRQLSGPGPRLWIPSSRVHKVPSSSPVDIDTQLSQECERGG
jgi:hypothetical protein